MELGGAVQQRVGLLCVVDSPGGQNHGAQGRISLSDQGIYRAHCRSGYVPNSILQSNTHPFYSSLNIIPKIPPKHNSEKAFFLQGIFRKTIERQWFFGSAKCGKPLAKIR
jgi:hypothetical protein